jgi:hypothetical protein
MVEADKEDAQGTTREGKRRCACPAKSVRRKVAIERSNGAAHPTRVQSLGQNGDKA